MRECVAIGGRLVGRGHPALLVAEIGQAHDGSLGMAHAFIDVVADCGVDAVKFQTHIASAESTLDEPFRTRLSGQDETRYAYWKRMEFTYEQWRGLADHAKDRGIIFLSSAFSVEAVKMLSSIGMPAWKLGSGELGSEDLISAMAATGKPMLISTGMSGWAEMDGVVKQTKRLRTEYVLIQCTSMYPTPLQCVGLNVLNELRHRFNCPVGLSDHSGSLWPSLAALARGANLVEVHATLHPKAFGPDVQASLTPDQIRILSDARDAFHVMDSNPINKDVMAASLAEMRALFGKSVATTRSLQKGDVLTEDILTGKKPATGIPVAEIQSLIGRRLARPVSPDRLLKYEDLEENSTS